MAKSQKATSKWAHTPWDVENKLIQTNKLPKSYPHNFNCSTISHVTFFLVVPTRARITGVQLVHFHCKCSNSCANRVSHTNWSDWGVSSGCCGLCILTEPAPVQVHRHEDRRNREEVHYWVHFEPEPQLVIGSNELFQGINRKIMRRNKIKKKSKIVMMVRITVNT